MAQLTYPFGSQAVTDLQYAALASTWQASGVIGSPTATDTSLKVFADSTGMQVKVCDGSALIRGFFFNSDEEVTVPVTASEAQPRIDLVVVKLTVATKTAVLTVVKGTADASPVPPAPTQTEFIYELPLAQVTVGALTATIAPADVTDVRAFDGRRVFAGPNVGETPRYGDLRVDDGAIAFWDGTNWVGNAAKAWSPTLSGITIGNGTIIARYQELGQKFVAVRVEITLGSSSSVTGAIKVGLPFPASNSGSQELSASLWDIGSSVYAGAGFLPAGSSDVNILFLFASSGVNYRVIRVTATNTGPFTWAAGDRINLQGVYERA
jgi:hypothetical protein